MQDTSQAMPDFFRARKTKASRVKKSSQSVFSSKASLYSRGHCNIRANTGEADEGRRDRR